MIMNKHGGFSLIKMVVGLALFTLAALMFADWLLTPGREQAAINERLRTGPDYTLFATDVIAEAATIEQTAAGRYNGKVLSVTGVVTAKSDSGDSFVVYLGPEVDARTVSCYFGSESRDSAHLWDGKVLTVRGVATVGMGNIYLKQCIVFDDKRMENELRAQIAAEQKAKEDAERVVPMTTREVSQARQRALWRQSNRPGQINGPQNMRPITQGRARR